MFDCSEVPAKPVQFTYRDFKVFFLRQQEFGVLKRQLQLFYGEIYFAVLDRQATHAGRKAVAIATALQKVAAL
jgi:hypothetical protein